MSRPRVRGWIWRRSDLFESSRLIALVTREEGRIPVLVKGAHRPTSDALGKLDLLNLVELELVGRPGTLRGATRIRLLHEARALREPRRFLAAMHLTELLDAALLEGRADPDLYDLVAGAVTLFERAPADRLPRVIAGLELRFLALLGVLPELTRCSHCGRQGGALAFAPRTGALECPAHGNTNGAPAARGARQWLATLAGAPAREWADLDPRGHGVAAWALLGRMLERAIERRLRLRRLALQRGTHAAERQAS